MKKCRSSSNMGCPIIVGEVIALGLRKLIENDSVCSFSQ
jgi:hypothetical protein